MCCSLCYSLGISRLPCDSSGVTSLVNKLVDPLVNHLVDCLLNCLLGLRRGPALNATRNCLCFFHGPRTRAFNGWFTGNAGIPEAPSGLPIELWGEIICSSSGKASVDFIGDSLGDSKGETLRSS